MSYEKFIADAPRMLFRLGWILGVLTLLVTIIQGMMMGPATKFFSVMFMGLIAALTVDLIPWIAAAVLWRIDRYLEDRK